jgi:hypothetical protein
MTGASCVLRAVAGTDADMRAGNEFRLFWFEGCSDSDVSSTQVEMDN